MKSRYLLLLLATLIGFHSLSIARDKNGATPEPLKNGESRVSLHPEYSTAEILRGKFTTDKAIPKIEACYQLLSSQRDVFKFSNPATELSLISSVTDELGYEHLRFQQQISGLSVWGCQTIVHFDKAGDIYLVGGQTIPSSNIDIQPSVSAATAAAVAKAATVKRFGQNDYNASHELLIFPGAGEPRLAWQVSLERSAGKVVRYQVFVDAHSGDILFEFDDLVTDGPTAGSGTDCLDTVRSIQSYEISGVNKLIDASRLMFTPPINLLRGVVATMIGLYDQSRIVVDVNGDNLWNDNDSMNTAVAAHYYAGKTYEYFRNTFNRNSYNNSGGSIYLVTYDSTVGNAAWLGSGLVRFNGGDGVDWRPWSCGEDVVSHEITHGVTASTAGLNYSFQSGALNESFSDFFAAMVDRDDWLIGEEVRISPPYLLRNMIDPHAGVNPTYTPYGYQPARMSEYQDYPISQDNGGVHINSGIPNRAGYLVSAAIGREKAEQIWYRTLTTYLTPSSSMYFWGDMTVRAAEDLYGFPSAEVAAVEAALDSIEIGYIYCDPVAISPFPVSLGGTADTTITVYNRSHNQITVLTATSATGNFDVQGTFPARISGQGSKPITLFVDALSSQVCDLGAESDTLVITTDAPIYPIIRIPVTVTTTLSDVGAQYHTYGGPTIRIDIENSPRIDKIYRNRPEGPVPMPPFTGLYEGTLMVGIIDGSDTTVYHNYGGPETERPFPLIDPLVAVVSPGGYTKYSCRIASPDGRIHGRVSYYWDVNRNINDNEYFVTEYTLTNPCDTALKIVSGMFCDFDLRNTIENFADYDESYNMAYVVDPIDSFAIGMRMLSGTPKNYRSVDNKLEVWPFSTFPMTSAYREMAAGSNTESEVLSDWSSILTFCDTTIAAGDTLRFQIAFMYSADGVAGLRGIADGIYPVYDDFDLYLDVGRIIEYVGADASINPPDSQIVTNFFGLGSVNWQASNSASWLQLTNTSGVSGQPIGFSYNALGMAPGTYEDTIYVDAPMASNRPARVVVQLNVVPGDGYTYVPAERATIQSAIDAASDGERIIVAPGEYWDNIDFNGKSIKLISEQGAKYTTLRAADSTRWLSRFENGESEWSELSGFEITGSTIGAMYIDSNAQVRITHNVFHDLGGPDLNPRVIEFRESLPAIINNVFYHNVNAWISVYGYYAKAEVGWNTLDANGAGISTDGKSIVHSNIIVNGSNGINYTNGTMPVCNNSWNNINNFGYSPNDLHLHNLSTDPLFCDAANHDYRLMPNSPCLPANNSCVVLMGANLGVANYECGDADGDFIINISDAVFLISYIFAGGPAPVPLISGDANCDAVVNISDAVYLISYIFAGGNAPCSACP